MLKKLIRKRKAVSPVIAVILLIGLTVLAGAVVAFIVLPMLNPPLSTGDFDIEADSLAGTQNPDTASFRLLINNKHSDDVTVEVAEFVYVDDGGNTRTETPTNINMTADTVSAGQAQYISFDIGLIRDFEYGVDADADFVSVTLRFTAGDTEVLKTFTFA